MPETKEEEEDLELTSLPGVGPATKLKLNDAGITSVLDLATAGPMDIADAVDIDLSKAVELNTKARKRLVELGRLDPDFVNAADLLKKRLAIDRISTGSKNLDDLLGGGIETWAMTEFFGEFGSGKCVAGDTNVVYTNDDMLHVEAISETYEKYKALNGEEMLGDGFAVRLPQVKVIGYDSAPTPADYIYRERVKHVFSIESERGRNVDAAFFHRFLTASRDGLKWVEAGRLKPGDMIATPRQIRSPSTSSINPDDAFFLGLFVAEGGSNPLGITNSDRKLISWVSSYLVKRFGFEPTVRMKKTETSPSYTVLLRNPVKHLLGELAVSNSYTKFVPASVMGGDDEVVRYFLAGYLEGDGYVTSDTVEMSSNSKRLIEEVSYLLLRLGITSTYSVKDVSTGPHYALRVSGFDRTKLVQLPFLSKSVPHASVRNSKFGTPLGDYLRLVFKQAVGSTRWHFRREGPLRKNGTVYEVFTRSAYGKKGLSDSLLLRIKETLAEKVSLLQHNLDELDKVDFSQKADFRRYARSLGFAVTELAADLGLTKSGMNNYHARGVPGERVDRLKEALRDEILRRLSILRNAIVTIEEAAKFNWDSVRKVAKKGYDGYVYDLSVPEGHAFVGGNLPTVMHNSQICHTLCVMAQMPKEKGGVDGGAVYVDTEGTFRPERIQEIAEARGLKADEVLARITVARAYNSAHQELIVKEMGKVIEANKLKLVILDSAVAHYRAEFVGRATLAERQQRLNRFMHQLLRTAEVYNVAVVVTNQVQAAPDSFFGDPTRPTGGHVVAHTSTYRIYLRKAAKNRIARMVDSPYHPERDAVFMLDEKGVDDPPEESVRKR